jgi:hypothetical protein
MSKISYYPSAETPLELSDRLIGTEAIRLIPSATPLATKNFSLGELLNLFSNNFPAASLQAVLDTGNTATQNITLIGNIDSTSIEPTNIKDILGSEGTTFQYLSKAGAGINWVDLPQSNLQSVLDAGNTATQNITLIGSVSSTLIIPGNIEDEGEGIGLVGQVLTKSITGVIWADSPSSFTAGLNDVLIVGNTATNDIVLIGDIKSTTITPENIVDINSSTGLDGQVLLKKAGGIEWKDVPNPPLDDYVPYEGATTDVLLGGFGISLTNVEFSNSPSYIPVATPGNMYWGDTDGTVNLVLKGGNVVLQVGQEQVLRVVNKTATNINLLESNYQAVRITGAQGQRIKVDLALATSDSLSAETIGLVTETINNNQEGFVTTSGLVRGINTTGSLQGESWADGDVLYLSPTVAGRITKVKPVAPNHLVIIGYVVHAHITQGSIFVKVDNGYELEELHNVTSTNFTTPISTDSVLTYDITTSLWKRLTLANLKTYLTNIRRNSQSGNINYCGYAPAGSLESSAVWTITKITVATNGTVTTQVFNNVTWTSVPF